MRGNGNEREWEWDGMEMSVWKNNGNGNKFLAGLVIRLKLMGVGKNGKAESHSRRHLNSSD